MLVSAKTTVSNKKKFQNISHSSAAYWL